MLRRIVEQTVNARQKPAICALVRNKGAPARKQRCRVKRHVQISVSISHERPAQPQHIPAAALLGGEACQVEQIHPLQQTGHVQSLKQARFDDARHAPAERKVFLKKTYGRRNFHQGHSGFAVAPCCASNEIRPCWLVGEVRAAILGPVAKGRNRGVHPIAQLQQVPGHRFAETPSSRPE
ncbi:MAG: hypothetical protein BWZ01_03070 [Deltaproteobacteria bacterium ADurb.BinA179]|nr:MAG: hypothetical protein BWZ01_03070 [Deltaproteobacteria bacterium ADurb.BinA179]